MLKRLIVLTHNLKIFILLSFLTVLCREVTMAKARVEKKIRPMVKLPECPICLETISAPVFQCESGHSLCNPCNKSLNPPICPICRQSMTKIRNRQLEDMIAKATRNCPNQASGCTYKTGGDQVDNHVKECIFRVMTCPLAIFGRCSWSGALKEMLDHVADSHQPNMIANLNKEIIIDNISVTKDDRIVYIVPQGKFIYILTLKIDISQQLAYWVVQLIGCKKVAQQHVYEINIRSLQDNRRKFMYQDHCFSDVMETAEIFHQAKCCVMPLGFFEQFINEKKVSFNLNLKRYLPTYTRTYSGSQQSNPNVKNRGKSPSPLHRNSRTRSKSIDGQVESLTRVYSSWV